MQEDIPGAFAKGDSLQVHHCQAVEKIFAEGPFGHHLHQIPPGRGQDPHIHGHGMGASDPVDLTFLQHTKQFHLHMEGHIADLVEENRPAVGLFELARLAAFFRSGKGSALIPEELGLEQIFRNRPAVDRHERLVPAAAGQMDRLGHDLLARAGLPGDQDRKVTLGGLHAHLPDPHDLDVIAQHVLETALAEHVVLVALFIIIQLCLAVFAGDLLCPVGKFHLRRGAQKPAVFIVDAEAQGRDPYVLDQLHFVLMPQILTRIRLQIYVLPAVDEAVFHHIIHARCRDCLLNRMPNDLIPALRKVRGILLIDLQHDAIPVDDDESVIRILKQTFQDLIPKAFFHHFSTPSAISRMGKKRTT